MTKLVCFLGTSKYYETVYTFQDRECTTCYFPVAAAEFFQPDCILLFVTKAAEDKHLERLRAELGGRFELRPVNIPEGKREEELWELFSKLTSRLGDGDDVIFDITFGFRSIPVLATIAASYLRVARNVRLQKIVYGAYEAKDQQGKAPVFDLTPFLALLDWTTATYLFLQTGIAAPLVERLRQANWSSGLRAEALEEVTAAMRLTRPDEARSLAYQFSQALSTLHLASPAAKPFELLLDQVRDEFARIAPRSPQPDDLEQELREEYALIQWNFNRGQFLSAITVTREWLVSLLCWHANWTTHVTDKNSGQAVPAWRSEEVRKKGEKALNHLKELATLDEAERAKQIGSKTPIAQELWKRNAAYAEQLGSAWGLASSLRNDLNHAGKVHSTTPRSLRDILHEIECTRRTLTDLFTASGLESHPTPTL